MGRLYIYHRLLIAIFVLASALRPAWPVLLLDRATIFPALLPQGGHKPVLAEAVVVYNSYTLSCTYLSITSPIYNFIDTS